MSSIVASFSTSRHLWYGKDNPAESGNGEKRLMELIFEWDAEKASTNFKKHRVEFEEAKTVFSDQWLLTYPDEIHSKTESRFISIGHSSRQRLLLVVHTESVNGNEIRIRIISSRKALGAERRAYEQPQA